MAPRMRLVEIHRIRVGSGGLVVVPASLLLKLGLEAGDDAVWVTDGRAVLLRAAITSHTTATPTLRC